MKGYKAFGKGLVCMGKQYAENATFEEDEVEICEKGMHFCENAIDVLDYYGLIEDDMNLIEVCEVESEGRIETKGNKFCTDKLHVGKKLSFDEFVEKCSSGDCARFASSGDYAQLASSGDCARFASSGYGAKLASSGYGAKLVSSGDYAQLASSGDCTQLASSGDCAQLASSGYGAQLASSGYGARMASSGYGARMESSGDCSVIVCCGNESKAKAKKGSWITLAEWIFIDGKHKPVCVKTEYVDGERIKEDTFYGIKDGEFYECKKR